MSRNGSGTYTLPSGNPVVSGTLIEATWANTTLSDIASSLTDSLSRSGQGGMTAALRLFDGTSSVPGLAWGSETTTGFYRAGAGDTRLVVTGSQVMQFLSTGVAVTGTLSASGNFAINTDKFTVAASSGNTAVAGTLGVTGAATLSSTLAVTGATTLSSTLAVNGATVTVSNSTAFFPQIINRNTTSDANASYLVLDKIRGSSVVQNGDVLGNLVFRGFDGTQYLQGAYINAVVSAAPGTNDMPADLVFGTTADGGAGPSERMRLNAAGNLGLGVTPSATSSYKNVQNGNAVMMGSTSDVSAYWNSNATFNSGWKYISNGTSARYEQTSLGGHQWFTAPSGTAGNAISFTQAMTLDASGNLGVGTTSPSVRLHVANSGGDNVSYFERVGGSRVILYNASGDSYFGTTTNTPLRFATNDTERARIDSSGRFMVGTSSADSNRFRVYDANSGAGTGSLSVTSAVSGSQLLYVRSDGYVSMEYTYNNITSAFGANMVIGSGGYIYRSTSALKYKTDIRDLESVNLDSLRPVRYKSLCNDDDANKDFIGFIADEAADNGWEELVSRNENGEIEGFQYERVTALLWKKAQEQQALINAQQAALQTLTARVTALEGTQP